MDAVAPAWLPDYRPIYHYRSVTRNGGALDVTPSLGQITPGMLFRVRDGGWNALDDKEGAPDYYKQRSVTVLTADGGMIEAMTYCVIPEKQTAFIKPTPDYAQLVDDGLTDWGLPTQAHRQAANNALPTFAVRHVFAYGRLQAEYDLGRSVKGIEHRQAARTRGRLFDLGSYPAWQPTVEPDAWVQGELLTLSQPAATLKQIDTIERFIGYGEDSLYHRVLVTAVVTETGENVLAWCYRYAQKISEQPLIADGRWSAS